jgi:periplasmic protein CpxP/Spy
LVPPTLLNSDTMGNLKFYKLAIALLLLLNIGTLTFLWTHRPPGGGGGPFMFLVKATHMDDAQKGAYEQLRTEHRAQMNAFRANNSLLRGRLFELLATQDANAPEVQKMIDLIASSRKQEEITTFEHFRKVRGLCRPDQQAKFDAAIGEAVQSLGPPGRN